MRPGADMTSMRTTSLIRAVWLGLPAVAGLVLLSSLDSPVGTSAAIAAVVVYGLIATLLSRVLLISRKQVEISQHLALHDPVTDLANRTLFHDRTQQAIALAEREGHELGVMLLDLDGFKNVNDTLGHHSGDLLLYRVGEQLSDVTRSSDSIARLGGDEFAVLLANVHGEEGLRNAAERVLGAVNARYEVQGVEVQVEASLGATLYPGHGGDSELLIQRADVAMYWAKRSRSGFEMYCPDRDDHSVERLALIPELKQAIEEEQLVVFFQPQADLRTSKVTGVEALLRWEHPTRGFMAPDEFIPVAESTGLIHPLTRYVLDKSLAQCKAWASSGLDLTVAVNLSARNLMDATLPETLAGLLDKHQVRGEMLELEVTESMMLIDPKRSGEILTELSDLGARIAIDDFGTGYTSLSWLKRLPVDTLKIDRSFVMTMETDEENSKIVRSAINLARDLGLEVVAEGVEGGGAWGELTDLGCDHAQGYLLSRPQHPDQLTPWLRDHYGRDIDPRKAAEKSANPVTA